MGAHTQNRAGGGGIKSGKRLVLWGIGGIVAVLLLLTFLIGKLLRTEQEESDRHNLMSGNPSFEETGPDGTIPFWTLDRPGKNRITATESHHRHLKKSLMIEKSPDPDNFVLECRYDRDIDLSRLGTLNLRTWYRTDLNYRGFVALKIVWYTKGSPLPLLEEVSPANLVTVNWEEISALFVIPPRADTARVALICFGKGGQVFFDHVRLYGSTRTLRAKETVIGSHRVHMTRNGSVCIGTARGVVLSQAALTMVPASRRSSSPSSLQRSSQILTPVQTLPSGADTLNIRGGIYDPETLQVIPYEQFLSVRDGWLHLRYAFPLPMADTFPRFEVSLNVVSAQPEPRETAPNQPRILAFMTVPDAIRATLRPAVAMTPAIQPREKDQALTFSGETARLTRDETAKILSLEWSLRLEESAQVDPLADVLRAARDAEAGYKYGQALKLYRQVLQKGPSAPEQTAIEAKIQELLDLESSDWERIKNKATEAELSHQAPAAEESIGLIQTYLARFQESARTEADDFRKKMEGIVREAKERDQRERPRWLLIQAEQYIDAGKVGLATEFLEVVVMYYRNSPEAKRAQELLSRIKK